MEVLYTVFCIPFQSLGCWFVKFWPQYWSSPASHSKNSLLKILHFGAFSGLVDYLLFPTLHLKNALKMLFFLLLMQIANAKFCEETFIGANSVKTHRGIRFGTVPKLTREFALQMNLFIPANGVNSWANLIHGTASGKDAKACGDRMVAIFAKPKAGTDKTILRISACISGNPNFLRDISVPTGEWTHLAIGQEKVGSEFKFQVYVNGKGVISVVNNEVHDFQKVIFFGSNPWHPSVKNAQVKQFKIATTYCANDKQICKLSCPTDSCLEKSYLNWVDYKKCTQTRNQQLRLSMKDQNLAVNLPKKTEGLYCGSDRPESRRRFESCASNYANDRKQDWL